MFSYRFIRCFTYLFLLAFLSSCASQAMLLQRGKRSFEDQNYRQAFIRLKPLAQAGQPDAQYAVGYMYYYGQGVIENKSAAIYWMKEAAKQQQTDAIAALKLLSQSQ